MGNRGVEVDKTIAVAAPADQLFRLWRDLENLPRFMSHLERVKVTIPLGVHVSLQYNPPGAAFGHAIASLFGEDAGRQIEEDVEAFKRRVENGELAA